MAPCWLWTADIGSLAAGWFDYASGRYSSANYPAAPVYLPHPVLAIFERISHGRVWPHRRTNHHIQGSFNCKTLASYVLYTTQVKILSGSLVDELSHQLVNTVNAF